MSTLETVPAPSEDDAAVNELIVRVGPERFAHYHAFPLGLKDEGTTVRLAFSDQSRKDDMAHAARELGRLIRRDGAHKISIVQVPESEMRFYERRLVKTQDRLDRERTIITDADRVRADAMTFTDETMLRAMRVLSEETAYDKDVVGLVYDVERQTLLVGAEDDSAELAAEIKAQTRVDRVLVRKMPIREIRARIQQVYAASRLTASTSSEVKRVLDEIVGEAVHRHVADIAIEESEADGRCRVRFGIDGGFQPCRRYPTLERDAYLRLVNVVRELGKVSPPDANECGDGRLSRTVEGREVNLRINTMPYRPGGGQRIAMRVITDLVELRKLSDLGLTDRTYNQFRRAMRRPGAFNVIAGPVGEGKTTTGYTLLKTFVDFDAKNVMSLEDPIEFPIPGINQFLIDANERGYEETGKGNTFARLLRASVRAYPHFLYLGEIRDDETASEAMRAATTGISLLSTTHAPDAVQAINRLMKLGVSRFDLAQNLKMSASQRLIRKLCDDCKVRTKAISREAKALAFTFGVDLITMYDAHDGGCRRCDGTGYRDRIAAFEVLEVNSAVANAVENLELGTVSIAQTAVEHGYRPMAVAALEHLAEGRTSLAAIVAKLSFADAQRYVRPGTGVVSYVDPEEHIDVDTEDAGRNDLLRPTSAA